MNIQVFGTGGMLWQAVVGAVLQAGHAVVIDDRDITQVEAGQVTEPAVINCAGIVKQRADVSPARLVQVNAYGPQRLSEACDAAGARLVHVSTDCVFSAAGPHGEDDTPTPNDLYDYAKLAGEVARPPHLTVRTSFVGRGKRGLLADLMRLPRGSVCREPAGALWTGHTVDTVAALLVALAARPDVTGLLHIPGEAQARPELVQRLSDRFGLGLVVEATGAPAEDRRLVSNRWVALGLPIPPPFSEQLERLA